MKILYFIQEEIFMDSSIMRRATAFFLLLALTITSLAQGPRNSIKIGIMPLLTGCPMVNYERAFLYRQSVEVGLAYRGPNNFPIWENSKAFNDCDRAFITELGYKINLNRKPASRGEKDLVGELVKGFYLKGRLSHNQYWKSYDCFVGNDGMTIFTENRTFRYSMTSVGILLGYQFISAQGFTADFSLGANIPILLKGPEPLTDNIYGNYNYNSFLIFTGGIRLGWSF